ncbi:hypothetical protein HAU46_05060 [Weissella confusa]|uniref:SpaA isopeptide-forming pilin-related protein n=1 Tax=Weissella confusa TaxID=1583 RepID=UPI0018F1CF76|nr:SpaA isopeptide-forming pilin-related protein [Weissella confusa]MBJ7647368.1 hypothetical protein [Weissella confusa]
MYNEENGENLLPADNRSVDLTMAFEQVANESTSESANELETEDKKDKKDTRILPNANDALPGFLENLNGLPTATIGGSDVQGLQIRKNARASTDNNSVGFQGYIAINGVVSSDLGTGGTNKISLKDSDTAYNNTRLGAGQNDATVEMRQKYDKTAMAIDWTTTATGMNHVQTVRNYYYDKYEELSTSAGQSAYLIEFKDTQQSSMTGVTATVLFDNAGVYINGSGEEVKVGASLTISNIKAEQSPRNDWPGGNPNHALIDIPNNLYSGIFYQGIDRFDMAISFYTLDSNGNFDKLIKVENTEKDSSGNLIQKAQFTFGSMNNHSGTHSTGRDDAILNSAAKAETVSQLIGGTESWTVIDKGSDMVNSADTRVDTGGRGNIWYSQTYGDYDTANMSAYSNEKYGWVDQLGSTTYERGALSYPVSGTEFDFRFYSGTGNTWQSITSAKLNPIAMPQPYKLVNNDNDVANAKSELAEALAESEDNRQYGAYDDESVSQATTWTDNSVTPSVSYFVYNYWIMQQTYMAGEESIAKPNKLDMTDLLPTGSTLRHFGIDTNNTNVTDTDGDVIVYSTADAGTTAVLTPGQDYTVSITKDSSDSSERQLVEVSMTETGLGKIKFNQDYISYKLRVRVPVMAAFTAPNNHAEWINEADVLSQVGGTQKTNKVKTKLDKPEGNLSLKLQKKDSNGNSLSGASFKLEQLTEYETWSQADNKWVGEVTLEESREVQPNGTGDDGASWTWDQTKFTGTEFILPPGQYRLTENAPAGYVGIAPLTFTINYERLNDDSSDPTFDDMKMVIDDGSFPAEVTVVNASGDTGDIKGLDMNVANAGEPATFSIRKTDGDGADLKGAHFQIKKVGDDATLEDLTDDNDPVHSLPENYNLEFYRASNPVVYQVIESEHPSGYALVDDLYFKVVSKSDFAAQSITPPAGADVVLVQTNKEGTANYGVEAMTKNGAGTYTVQFDVANSAKSIFPRVGGTGIQAYIGAGLIVMLIAGGAAWYIKRRQNQ